MPLMLGIYSAPYPNGSLLLDATPFVTSCSYSENKHGYESLAATIPRPLSEAFRFFNQAGTAYVRLTDGIAVLWEGRLEDPGIYANDTESGLSLQGSFPR